MSATLLFFLKFKMSISFIFIVFYILKGLILCPIKVSLLVKDPKSIESC